MHHTTDAFWLISKGMPKVPVLVVMIRWGSEEEEITSFQPHQAD